MLPCLAVLQLLELTIVIAGGTLATRLDLFEGADDDPDGQADDCSND